MDKRTQKKKIIKEVAWFLVKFNLLLIPFYAITFLDINFYPIQEYFTNFVASILKVFGYSSEVDGIFIYIESLVIDISRDCIGWKSIYSVTALVLASPGILKKKLKFLALWISILFVINIFRVVGTILIGLKFGVYYLEIIHKFVWQEIMIIVIISVWYLWLRKVIKLNKKK